MAVACDVGVPEPPARSDAQGAGVSPFRLVPPPGPRRDPRGDAVRELGRRVRALERQGGTWEEVVALVAGADVIARVRLSRRAA